MAAKKVSKKGTVHLMRYESDKSTACGLPKEKLDTLCPDNEERSKVANDLEKAGRMCIHCLAVVNAFRQGYSEGVAAGAQETMGQMIGQLISHGIIKSGGPVQNGSQMAH